MFVQGALSTMSKKERKYHGSGRLSPGPGDAVDATIAAGGNLEEKLVGNVDGALCAVWASIEDGGSVHVSIVVDVDLLTTVGISVGVDTIGHVRSVDGYEIITVGARNTARPETDGDIIVCHVARVGASGAGRS